MKTQLELLEERKAEIEASLETLISLAETEARAATDEEQTAQDDLVAEHRAVADKIVKAKEAAAIRAQRGVALDGAGTPPARTELRTEPYRRGGKDSYYNDLAKAARGDSDARDRLVVNDKHRADKQTEQRAGETTVTGAGGEFSPPLWAVDQFIALARPRRTTADLVNNVTVPDSVSSISLPKILTGTTTAAQGTQNTAVSQTDITTGSVTTTFSTLAGGALISQQLIDQSPISMDDVITADLARDLAGKVDAAVIAALAAVSGLNAVTYTTASPTSLLLGQYAQQAIDLILGGNFAEPNAIVMRPDRWGRLLAAGDTAGRPFVLPNAAYGRYNSLGTADGPKAQGIAGEYRGVPVYLDPLIPVNLGAGTNQDEIFVLDSTQVSLYESAPKVEAFQQTFANTLSLYVRIYEYYGIIANRLPKAISLITGTGMIPGNYGL